MDSKRTSYSQTLKLRWSLLLLTALVAFVLLANARQVQSPVPTPAEPLDPATAATDSEYTPRPESRREAFLPIERLVSFIDGTQNAVPNRTVEKIDTRETIVISHGDTLSGILNRFNVHSAFGELLNMKKQIAPLLKLKPGKPMHLEIKNGELISLVYEHSRTEQFELARNEGRYIATERVFPVEKREAYAFGVIRDSFYHAGREAGLSNRIIIEIADILGWDIDFALDVRTGDLFSVVYEEQYLDGNKLDDGRVLAVEFLNNGKTYRALRYTDIDGKSGYFTPEGKNMRKAFLRNPIEYARISSHFNPKRLHPIFNTVRPHRGVDYAAPTGTPVRASGDGKITFRGRKTGYGNTVIIQHGQTYSTLYAHLSRFAAGQRHNSRVRQKQVIGYVGSTGYATGPHLHYEFRVNGVHKNPLTVNLPKAKPLPKNKMAHFKRTVSSLLSQLDTLNGMYASISPE